MSRISASEGADPLKYASELGVDVKHLYLACIALPLALTLAGCDKDDTKLAFNHNQHVVDNDIACATCHGKATDGRYAAAGHEACKDCHEDWMDEKKIGEKTCGVCHKVKEPTALAMPSSEKAKPATPPTRRSPFVHTDALSNRCTVCHSPILDKSAQTVPSIGPSERITIRDRAHTWQMNCSACHVDMDPTAEPDSHKGNWTKKHGQTSQGDPTACTVCHQQNACQECHQNTKPDSHNNLWRMKTHGTRAKWDRQSCLTCHKQDSCTACHAATAPQNHNAAWSKDHCLNCHPDSAGGSGCSLCHETKPADHPNPHPAAWSSRHCNSCHPGTPEGKQCAYCHKDVTVATHPNPHKAGWNSRHCDNCHPGTSEYKQCTTCHGGSLVANHRSPHTGNWKADHCKNCHTGASSTESCSICHAAAVSAHPSPHAAGYRSRHCTSCHTDPLSDTCGICHANGGSVATHVSIANAAKPERTRLHNNIIGAGGTEADCLFCHSRRLSPRH